VTGSVDTCTSTSPAPCHAPGASVGVADRTAHLSEGSAAAAPVVSTPVAALVAGHVLRDGELVLFILRPSRWFILLSSLRFLASVLIVMILLGIFDDRLEFRSRPLMDLGVFVMAGRIMWAILQWMGRYYILTDLRIIRLTGVFSTDIFDCPLRRVARTMLEVTFKERICRIGSMLIIPQDEQFGLGHWQMIPRPREVHDQVVGAINRAKQSGMGI